MVVQEVEKGELGRSLSVAQVDGVAVSDDQVLCPQSDFAQSDCPRISPMSETKNGLIFGTSE